MNVSDTIRDYNQIFKNKQQFIYFVYDNKLRHFEVPLRKIIPKFSSMYNSLDHKLISLLDACADDFNNSKSREDYEKAIMKNQSLTKALLSEDSSKKVSYDNNLYK